MSSGILPSFLFSTPTRLSSVPRMLTWDEFEHENREETPGRKAARERARDKEIDRVRLLPIDVPCPKCGAGFNERCFKTNARKYRTNVFCAARKIEAAR